MGPAPAKKAEFQFITSINTIARNDETRRKVRSHARRQKLPSDAQHDPAPVAPAVARKPASQKDRLSKFRLGGTDAAPATTSAKSKTATASKRPQTARARKQQQQIKQEFEHGLETHMVTPEMGLTVARELPNFPLLHIETTPMTETLLKYCMTVCLSPQEKFVERWFARNGAPAYMTRYYTSFLALSFAMNPEGDWLSSIHIDAAATHAFMALIASMHNSLANHYDTSTIDFHRFQALKSINERLKQEGKDISTPVSDGVIVACALLVNIESFIGSNAAAAAHMNGLQRMVELRGGLVEGFRYSTLLQRAIAWADFSYVTTANAPPRLDFVPNLAARLETGDQILTSSRKANEDCAAGYGTLTLKNEETVELMELLKAITERISSFDYAHLEKLMGERTQVSDSIYLLEWRLCQMEDLIRRGQLSMSPARRCTPAFADSDRPFLGADNLYSPPTYGATTTCDLTAVMTYASHLFLHLAIRAQPPTAQRHRALLESLMMACYEVLPALSTMAPTPPQATRSVSVHSNGSPRTMTTPESTSGHSSYGSEVGSMESWNSPATVTASESSLLSSSSWSSQLPVNSAVTAPATPSPKSPSGQKSGHDIHGSMLLWALFLGACVRLPPPVYDAIPSDSNYDHHGFFVSALRKQCHVQRVADRKMLVSRLEDVIWLGSWADYQLDLVWAEVMSEPTLPFHGHAYG